MDGPEPTDTPAEPGGAPSGRRWGLLIGAAVLGSLLVRLAIPVIEAVVGTDVAPLVVLAAAIVFLGGNVIWRRRRNRRLTGSPTTWPEGDGNLL